VAQPYDAIVVGARCAGSPTAMLLARKGYKVLLVERATFPSDTISTHVIHPLAVATLARWGLLDRLSSTGCPPIHTYSFDFGPFKISGKPGTSEARVAYCPRRTILDKLLIDAAADAGAEVREGFTVGEILMDDGRVVGVAGKAKNGKTVTERAAVVIGADGRRSRVAETVRPETYREKAPLLELYYSYWSDLPLDGEFATFSRPNRGFAMAPTHDGLTMIVAGWPLSEGGDIKSDIEGNFLKVFELAPDVAARIRPAKREAPFAGMPVPNYFRKPFGPGWVLVGDAGYSRDPITAQGITDAFRDAERCTVALDECLSGARSFEDAFGEYQRARDDAVLPMYEMTCALATLEPPPRETQELIAALRGNQRAIDGFMQMNAGTISPAEFFSPANIEAILGAARA
jgi:2-polyprenyl-6-methoxyphenol hydroxylase-like FAD-dependent oxidoreductase